MSYIYNLALAFYEVASMHSKRNALQFPDGQTMSYETLNTLSNKLALVLQKNNVSKGKVVAIFNDKSTLGYATILACLKIGAIYTNLDPATPWPRLKKILQNCNPDIFFYDNEIAEVQSEIKSDFPYMAVHGLQTPEFAELLNSMPGDNLEISTSITGSDPAYIMFTSGSTGFPKGAVMSHANVLNFIQWGRKTFKVTEEDVFTNVNPIYFDNSVFDFYISLFNGARLVPLKQELVKEAKQLVQAINLAKCTIWFSVPSLLVYLLTMKAINKEEFSTLRIIAFGGEGFPKNKLKQLYDMHSHHLQLLNVYGPTECTCICSSYTINEKDFVNMNVLAPLGQIAPNFDYKIIPLVDGDDSVGELALKGPCVGLGYYNDKERTAKSFIPDTETLTMDRMYLTGDIVELAQDGLLHFKGRTDNQVKHMGYRIELEEIEAAFSTLEYINESGVLYEKVNSELGQIKAFVSVSDQSIESDYILLDIKKILPPYMVPRVLIILPVLPKNGNGKIDRKQLAQFA